MNNAGATEVVCLGGRGPDLYANVGIGGYSKAPTGGTHRAGPLARSKGLEPPTF